MRCLPSSDDAPVLRWEPPQPLVGEGWKRGLIVGVGICFVLSLTHAVAVALGVAAGLTWRPVL